MGTSADFGGPKGGAWTAYKSASANYARHGGERQRKRLLSTFAKAVASGGGGGGDDGGGGGGGGGRVGDGSVPHAQLIAAFGATLANEGLDAALTEVGLQHLIGGDRFDVLGELLEELTGDGSTLDDTHAKAALNDAMGEVFPEAAQDYEQLSAVTMDDRALTRYVEKFVASYVFHEMTLVVSRHLLKCSTVAEQQERAYDLRSHITSLVAIETQGQDVKQIDWRGAEGRATLDAVVDNLQSILEAEE
jgi:hypothetical protein